LLCADYHIQLFDYQLDINRNSLYSLFNSILQNCPLQMHIAKDIQKHWWASDDFCSGVWFRYYKLRKVAEWFVNYEVMVFLHDVFEKGLA